MANSNWMSKIDSYLKQVKKINVRDNIVLWVKKNNDNLRALMILSLCMLLPLTSLAQGNLRDVPNPDPQFELRTLKVAEGFEVNLFASEPMLTKPIQMNWDARGRLWVVGSKHYPQLKPGEVPNDKIYVLEDTTGDGKADVSTIFAEGLHIPTGVLPGDGGVYVANATEILHLKDTNGDGKADQRRRVLSGFGTGDTHHLIHTFRWGPAGGFYFNQSIYIHSRVETPHGVKELKEGGTWRFQPETMELGVYSEGLINPWGLKFSRWGQSFLTDGAGSYGINYAFPGVKLTSWKNERVLHGLNPGQPKYSGLEIVSGRHLPDSLSGSLITNDFRANRINRFVLEEQGSGYVSNQAEDLLWSDNVAFRPVDISIGPDGAIYVADWYNPIIQHGEVDFRDPRRDHQHGRIWRIIAKDRPLIEKPQLNDASTEQLLDALKVPEKWTRSQAKRLLKERGAKTIVPELRKWIEVLNSTDPDYEHHLLEGLWVFQAVGVVNKTLLERVLSSQKHQARAAAVRVLSYWYENIDDASSWLKRAAADEHPQVRLEAVSALRKEKTAKAASNALSVLSLPMDNFLDFALWQTIRELEPYWMPEIESKPDLSGDPRKTAYALKSVNNPKAVTRLVRLYKQGDVPAEYTQDVFDSIAKRGNSEDLNNVLDLAMSGEKVHENRRATYLAALEEAARLQDRKPAYDLDRVIKFVDDENEQIAQSAIKLIGYWRLEKWRWKLGKLAREGNKAGIKQAALDALVLMDDIESRKLLIDMTGRNQSPALRRMAVKRLVSLDITTAADVSVDLMQEVTNQKAVSELFSAFFTQKKGPGSLADALAGQKISGKIAQQGMKAIQQHIPHHRKDDEDVKKLQDVFEKLGGELPPEQMPQQLSNREMNRLELDIKASADSQKGEFIFRELNCMSCHAIGGAGGTIGSDLSSLGANAPTDYIIESILNPSIDIKDGYELNRIVTKDESVITGYMVRETDSEIVIRDVAGREVSIPENQVSVHETVPGSLMPPGLTSSLERKEFVDLVGFLSRLGEQGKFRVPNTKVVRFWNVLNEDHKVVENIKENGLGYIVNKDADMSWQPAYSKVSGNLPLKELPVLALDKSRKFSFVAFDIEVLAKGKVELLLNSSEGITAWAGQNSLNLEGNRIKADLSRGIHRIWLAIDQIRYGEKVLRIQLHDNQEASAEARLVISKE